MDKMTKAMGRQWREEGKTNDASMDERGWEIGRERVRDCQRQSKNGREWVCIAEQRALQYIAVPSPCCVLCSPSGSMHWKDPCSSRAAQHRGLPAAEQQPCKPGILDMWWCRDFKGVMETWCPRQNSQPAPASACSQFYTPPGLCKRITHWLYAIAAESHQLPWPCFPSLGTSALLFAFVPEVTSLQTRRDTLLNLLKWQQ